MTGWIKLHRQVMEHWIWEDAERFKWWMEILLLTNHTDKKTVIGNNVVTIERGTFHTSELKLASKWGVSRNRVRRFLELLEQDGMISTKKTMNGTTIKVHNYNVYQGKEEQKKQPMKQQTEHSMEQQTIQQTEQRTDIERYKTKNVKNDKELKNVKNKRSSSNNNDDDFKTVINSYQENIEHTPAPITFQKLQQDFEKFGKEIMMYAIEKSALKNNHNYSFINYLLNDWNKKHLTTVEAIKQSEHVYEHKKQTSFQKNNQAPVEKTPEWLIKQQQDKNITVESQVDESKKQALLNQLENMWED